MSLDLRNFVNININYHSTVISSVTRGIVTLITVNTAYSENPYSRLGPNEDGIFYSLSDYLVAKQTAGITDESLDVYVKSFFGNKGKALQIVGGYSGTGDIDAWMLLILGSLNYRNVIIVSDVEEQILRKVASANATTTLANNPLLQENSTSTFSGLNEKMFISSTIDKSGKLYNSVPGSSAPAYQANTYYELDEGGQYVLLSAQPADWATNWFDYYMIADPVLQNYVIKVGEKGIEMLAAAYLSQVRIADSSSIQDYAFTVEDVKSFFSSESIIDDNNIGVNLIENHFNFDTNLVNAIRNYAGNTITGDDMMNYYIKILVTQDLSEAIMNLLASKIRFNQSGINRLNNAISQVMNTYITNGYLNTEYIWENDDLYYSFNGVDYLICARNTPLVKGYRCVILPITSLTAEQKEAHVLPPVYLMLADQTGIRMVVINGDVF